MLGVDVGVGAGSQLVLTLLVEKHFTPGSDHHSDTMRLTNQIAVDLLLAHMDIGSFMKLEDLFHPLGDKGSLFEDCVFQDDMGEKEEMNDCPESDGLVTKTQWSDRVRYGTMFDLLDFVNLISNAQSGLLMSDLTEEMGVVINKASPGSHALVVSTLQNVHQFSS